jgi:hypothetical protein
MSKLDKPSGQDEYLPVILVQAGSMVNKGNYL